MKTIRNIFVAIITSCICLVANFNFPDASWICDEDWCGTLNDETGPCIGCGKNPSEEQEES